MSKMVLLSKNFSHFSFGVLGCAERILACVIVWWGGKAFSNKVWSSLALSICFLRGLHLWAGLTGRRLSCAAGLPKSAFTAPSPDLKILQSSHFNCYGPWSDLCVRSGKSKIESLTALHHLKWRGELNLDGEIIEVLKNHGIEPSKVQTRPCDDLAIPPGVYPAFTHMQVYIDI